MVVVGYIIGIVLLFLLGAFIINSIKSLVEAVRARLKKKKSPDKGTEQGAAPSDDSGKEVL